MVFRDHRHLVARPDAAARQHRHHPLHPVEELRIGPARPLEHHRRFPWEPPRVQPQGVQECHRHGRRRQVKAEIPRISRPMINVWISDVPSGISPPRVSRNSRSTG